MTSPKILAREKGPPGIRPPGVRPPGVSRSGSRPYSPALLAALLLVVVGAVLSVFPFYWLFAAASRSTSEVLGVPPRLEWGAALLENLRGLLERGFLRNVWNSVFITTLATFGTLLVATCAGYAFGTLRFRGRNLLFALFFMALLLPPQVTVVPLFETMVRLKMVGSPWAVILPTLAAPFSVYYMRQTFLRFPRELLEAARIDGAGEWTLLTRVAVPNVSAALGSLGIFTFLSSWNGFFWPLVALGNDKEHHTLPVAISGLIGDSFIDYGALMAATALSVVPVLIFFLLAQRQFTVSPLAGAIKD